MADLMPKTPKTQPDKFRELARKLEANEDEKTFEDQVRRIAKAPPPEKPPEGAGD